MLIIIYFDAIYDVNSKIIHKITVVLFWSTTVSYWVKVTRTFMEEAKVLVKPSGSRKPGEVIFDSGLEDLGCNKRQKLDIWPKVFDMVELCRKTNSFASCNMIGGGTSGAMFYVLLDDGEEVALRGLDEKHFNPLSHDEFEEQVKTIAGLQHDNLIAFRGYSTYPDMHPELRALVYEYATKKSLYDILHDTNPDALILNWDQRLNIAIDAASGLKYLHGQSIAYQDLKSSNVLLFDNLKAKIADINVSYRDPNLRNVQPYCRSRIYEDAFAYYDLHCHFLGDYNEESDVYSFGVLLMELLTGMKILDMSRTDDRCIFSRAGFSLGKKKVKHIVDSRLGHYPQKAVAKVAALAAYCMVPPPSLRPDMAFVVHVLESIRDNPVDSEIDGRVKALEAELEEEPFTGSVAETIQQFLDKERTEAEFFEIVPKLSRSLKELRLNRKKEMLKANIWLLKY